MKKELGQDVFKILWSGLSIMFWRVFTDVTSTN
jgi:hypothetical protein